MPSDTPNWRTKTSSDPARVSSETRCPDCGAALENGALGGLCPACLVRQGLDLLGSEAQEKPNAPSLALPATLPVLQRDSSGAPPRLFGDYELLREIAHGGMGVVYQARQISLNRMVALKAILSGQLATTGEVLRFRVEAEAAAKLDHPNIVPIFEIGELDGQHYFSMKLIEGGRLSDLTQSGPVPADRAVRLLGRIARAVHYAHQHGVLHRDLKPTNILLDVDGEPHLTDFGLAKIIERDGRITQTQAVIGTANYMAPEQAGGESRQLTTATDVYGLGAILYEMLTGNPPFQADTVVETLRKVVEQEPAPPSSLNPAIDRDLETICLKCLEKLPRRRYDSAESLACDLDRWMAGEPILARPTTTLERAFKWVKRKPAIASLLVSLAAVTVTGVLMVAAQWKNAVDARIRLEQNSKELRRSLYMADISMAQRALRENNYGRALALLRQYFPDPGAEDLRGFEWRYLWAQARGDELATLQTREYVKAVAFSPDGRHLVSAGHGPELAICNLASRKIVHYLPLFPGENRTGLSADLGWSALQFSPDGRFLMAGFKDLIVVWDARTWDRIAQVENINLPLAFLPGGRIALGENRLGIVSLDLVQWRVLRDRPEPVQGIGRPRAVSREGRFVVALSFARGTLQVWDMSIPARLKEVPLPPDSDKFNRMTLSSDGRLLVAGDWSGRVYLWDTAGEAGMARFQAHSSPVYGLAFSPDGTTLATAGHDQVIHLWDTRKRTRIATFKGHTNEVWSIDVSPDGKLLATGGKDATIRFWNADARPAQTVIPGAVKPLCFSADGRFLSAIRQNHTAGWWEVATLREIEGIDRAELPEISDYAALVTTSEGDIMAGATLDGRVIVRSVRDTPQTRTLQAHVRPAYWMAFSRDGRRLATCSRDNVRVWDWASGTLLADFVGVIGPVALSPDGMRLVSCRPNFTASLWDINENTQLATLQAHKWNLLSVCFSPDSSQLLLTSMDANASLWDAKTGKLKTMLYGHREGVPCGTFSPDGKIIATGSTDETVKLWNAETGQELLTVDGFGADIASVLFSPDGKALAVGTDNNTSEIEPVRVLRAPSLAEVDVTSSNR